MPGMIENASAPIMKTMTVLGTGNWLKSQNINSAPAKIPSRPIVEGKSARSESHPPTRFPAVAPMPLNQQQRWDGLGGKPADVGQ
jgi:hypothetical protein